MSAKQPNYPLAFLWCSHDVNPAVVETARQASTGAIFEINTDPTGELAEALRSAGATDIKTSAEFLMDPACEDFLRDSGVKTLWVEYVPALMSHAPEAFLNRLRALSDAWRCIPLSGDLDFLTLAMRAEWCPPAIALKGAEAAGFVSKETVGVLYATLREMAGSLERAPAMIIWGGVSTPQAAAAFLCTGATSVVFESLHWGTDLVTTNPNMRQRLTGMRPEHTAVVGQNLGVPCRFFDKGNSLAVRGLRDYERSLLEDKAGDDARRTFARKVQEQAIPAPEGNLSRQELAFLGPEAAFAEAFVEQYGPTTGEAVEAFEKEVTAYWREAPRKQDAMAEGPVAQELGTKYPFIQGAMTWISDVPGFARSVSEAGGLPTIALGLKSPIELNQELDHLKEVMGGSPYAVNFVALPENPQLEQQLTWIEQHRPPFAVIAAGEPSYAARLQGKGIRTIYVAPSEGLIRMALEAGVRFLILEGNEAGGHVGEYSTLTLAQIALELKRKEPELFKDRYLVLAGGIFNRETVFRAAMLGADALQMGTAYLATSEIVSTGALSPVYQRLVLDSGPGMTAVSGESVGLRVRSLKTAKMDSICSLEREWAAGRHDEGSFRRRLETLSANSLLVAARGVERPNGPALDEETCIREGQFMSGAIAGALSRVLTLAEFHRTLAEGPLDLTLPEIIDTSAQTRGPRLRSDTARERVAITGMAQVNSLGNSPGEIWEACLALRSGITEVPHSRWDHDLYYNPDPRALGKTYCRVGAFQNFNISRKDLDIAPQDFRSMADATKLSLWLADEVIRQSGLLDSGIPKERIGVLMSQNSGETASTVTDLVFDVHCHDVIQCVRGVVPMTPEQETAAIQEIRAGRLTVDDTTLLGRLNCAAGGFICNRYGFQGPSYAVSAACATSLVALHSAIQMIRNGILDAAVLGGGEEQLHPSHYMEFSALKALAGLSGRNGPVYESSRPFDADRDGMVLGEGGGMIVLERESLAERRGAPIQAYIAGVGASNNDRGMVESLAETQEIAIRAAFQDADFGPDSVDLVECHATSTVQGDAQEVKALKTFYSPAGRTMLTAFKSQIGHTLGASGINSLIRGVAALQTGIFPPTLNYRTPDPDIELEAGGFHVPLQPAEWPRKQDRPRRLQVNAFGFGGANYVVQLEECREATGRVMLSASAAPASAAEATDTPELPDQVADRRLEGVSFFVSSLAGRRHRLGVVASDEGKARARVEALKTPDQTGPLSEKSMRIMARQGIFAAPVDDMPEPLAFLFAGQGTQYAGMSKELYQTFPEIRTWMDRIAAVADFDLLDLLFHSAEEDLQKTRWQQPALYTMEFAMVKQLMSMGASPQAMAGHSLGELVAMSIAGMFSIEDGFRIVNKRAQCMDKASGLRKDPGTMIASDAPLEYLEEKVSGSENIYVTNYNSPLQVVLGGDTEPVLALMEEIKARGHRATQLKVSMAFHSPIMKVIHEEMKEFVSGIPFHPPRIPVISNTTNKPYPDDPDESRRILMAHLESPVHWMQNLKTLYEDFDIRLFVEIGPRDTLCNLVVETLGKTRCFPTCLPEGEVEAYRAGAAQLYALGHLRVKATHPGEAGATPRPAPSPSMTRARTYSEEQVAAIVQREIDTLVRKPLNELIRDQVLHSVRRELDPGFTQERLDQIFAALPMPSPLAESRRKSPPPAPASAAEPVKGTRPSSPVPELAAEDEERVPGEASGPESVDHVEQVIRIIMNATGYDRDEIEPEMDIRRDLAIRSSRLPVIMDEIERTFEITINVEDFVNVRTVGEIADRIQDLAGRTGEAAPTEKASDQATESRAIAAADLPSDKDLLRKEPIKRLILEEAIIPQDRGNPLTMEPGQTVAVLRTDPGSDLAAEISHLLERRFGTRPLQMDCRGRNRGGDFDLCADEGAERAADKLKAARSLAGIVLILEHGADSVLPETANIPSFLTGFFRCLKSLVNSKDKAFCTVILRDVQPHTAEAVAGEGLLGMLLGAAQEYPSVLFRSVALDTDTDTETALDMALDTKNPVIQLICRDQKVFSLKAVEEPLCLTSRPAMELGAEDVVVISGGAKGVTYRIAQALAPFKSKIVLLGRTELDPHAAYGALRNTGDEEKKSLLHRLTSKGAERKGDNAKDQKAKALAGLDIARSVSRLSALGPKVSYHRCDIADSDSVARALEQVVDRYGRIDGIIHGAGVIKDNFIEYMTPEDFRRVVEVKLLGASNLYHASKDHGLRFFAALSSLVAIQGNVGQANYCAANRSLSSLLRSFAAAEEGLISKALMLPPIEGTGMADDPEVKELMKLKGLEAAFVHADDLAQIFCRELFLGPPGQTWVAPARTFPAVKGTLVQPPKSAEDAPYPSAGAVRFQPADLPLIGAVDELDLKKGVLTARRAFSRSFDLWIEDHKPFKFLKHPLVSGIMAVETFLEAAHLLYPHLSVLGVRRLRFEDILECPEGIEREAKIICRRLEEAGPEIRCDVQISSADISPSGRLLDTTSTNYRGQVILGPRSTTLTPWPDFDVKPEELDTNPLEPGEIQDRYERRTGLEGRYRVLESLQGTGPEVVRGETIYGQKPDMAGLDRIAYQYSPYLLEALMHVIVFHAAIRQDQGTDGLIPAGMEEMRFARPARVGEHCNLEARLRARDDQGFTWDARALDEEGTPIMQVRSMRMNRFSQ